MGQDALPGPLHLLVQIVAIPPKILNKRRLVCGCFFHFICHPILLLFFQPHPPIYLPSPSPIFATSSSYQFAPPPIYLPYAPPIIYEPLFLFKCHLLLLFICPPPTIYLPHTLPIIYEPLYLFMCHLLLLFICPPPPIYLPHTPPIIYEPFFLFKCHPLLLFICPPLFICPILLLLFTNIYESLFLFKCHLLLIL